MLIAGSCSPRTCLVAGALLVSLLACPTAAGAEVRRLCLVSYQTDTGWSEEVPVEVRFDTGGELNRSRDSFSYFTFSRYARFTVGRDDILVEHVGFFRIDDEEFTNDTFLRMFDRSDVETFREVAAGGGAARMWRVKAREADAFLDPRAENPKAKAPRISTLGTRANVQTWTLFRGLNDGPGAAMANASTSAPRSRATSTCDDCGSVRLRIDPSNALVFVDGVYLGHADEFDGIFRGHAKLQAGPRTFEFRAPGFPITQRILYVERGHTITLRLDLAGKQDER